MRTRPFGFTGVAVPIIGQGTWQMEHDDPRAAVTAIQRGIELGLRHIDTAELYGDGHVEELVGRALSGRRSRVFLASKVLPENASRAGTIAACERSLRRLRTDHLDLYLLHWPGSHPLEETISAFERLERAGKIRAFGVSNFDASELERALEIAGAGRIACNQVLYHLGERAVEHDLLPFCESRGVPLVAYSPFGSGDFPGPTTARGRVLAEVAARYGASARQVALAFIVRHPSVFTIPKNANERHVEENAGAADLDLDDSDVARIDAAFPRGRRRRGVPTL